MRSWGSLYDALYGTDALGARRRPAQVRRRARRAGNRMGPAAARRDVRTAAVTGGSHADVSSYRVRAMHSLPIRGGLPIPGYCGVDGTAGSCFATNLTSRSFSTVTIRSARATRPASRPAAGERGFRDRRLRRQRRGGQLRGEDPDLPQLARAVKGELAASFDKGGRMLDGGSRPIASTRRPAAGDRLTLKVRACSSSVNVGLLWPSMIRLTARTRRKDWPMRLSPRRSPCMTSTAASQQPGGIDLHRQAEDHGPEEPLWRRKLFERPRILLGLARGTHQIGVMDEERRTSVQSRATIHAVRDRVASSIPFARPPGDEIHSSSGLSAQCRKAEIEGRRLAQGS